jgi:hypothetical protein
VKVVADTGPLIALAKIEKLALLRHLGEIMIPPEVRRELLGRPGDEAEEIDHALDTFLQVMDLPPYEASIEQVLADLDEGERQAIQLAVGMKDEVLLLMDDQRGRKAAGQLAVPTTGVVGLLLRWKEKGVIDHVSSLISMLRAHGYWLSDDIAEHARRMAGEAE